MRIKRGAESPREVKARDQKERTSASWCPLRFERAVPLAVSINPGTDIQPTALMHRESWDSAVEAIKLGRPMPDYDEAQEEVRGAFMDDLRMVCMSAFRETFRG